MKLNLNPLCLITYKPDLGTRDGETIYGLTRGFCVWIREDVRDDEGILKHELEHIRQFWKMGIFHMILLNFPAYRARCEKRAMERQEG
jgi:hypothetical protein